LRHRAYFSTFAGVSSRSSLDELEAVACRIVGLAVEREGTLERSLGYPEHLPVLAAPVFGYRL